jgi:nucleotide-binding universal stress UspA family protein
MYERVVVPLDGSEQAEGALTHAVDLAVVAGPPCGETAGRAVGALD